MPPLRDTTDRRAAALHRQLPLLLLVLLILAPGGLGVGGADAAAGACLGTGNSVTCDTDLLPPSSASLLQLLRPGEEPSAALLRRKVADPAEGGAGVAATPSPPAPRNPVPLALAEQQEKEQRALFTASLARVARNAQAARAAEETEVAQDTWAAQALGSAVALLQAAEGKGRDQQAHVDLYLQSALAQAQQMQASAEAERASNDHAAQLLQAALEKLQAARRVELQGQLQAATPDGGVSAWGPGTHLAQDATKAQALQEILRAALDSQALVAAETSKKAQMAQAFEQAMQNAELAAEAGKSTNQWLPHLRDVQEELRILMEAYSTRTAEGGELLRSLENITAESQVAQRTGDESARRVDNILHSALQKLSASEDARRAEVVEKLQALEVAHSARMAVNQSASVAARSAQMVERLQAVDAAHSAQVVENFRKSEAAHATQLTQIKAAHGAQLQQMKALHDAQLIKLRQYVQAIKTRYEQEVQGVKAKYDKDVQGVKAKYDEDVQGVKAKYDKDVQGVEAKYNEEVQGMKAKYAQEAKAAHTAINAAHTAMALQTSQVSRSLEDALQSTQGARAAQALQDAETARYLQTALQGLRNVQAIQATQVAPPTQVPQIPEYMGLPQLPEAKRQGVEAARATLLASPMPMALLNGTVPVY